MRFLKSVIQRNRLTSGASIARLIAVYGFITASAFSQLASVTNLPAATARKNYALTKTPAPYKRAALAAVIREANTAAIDLGLESGTFTSSNIIHSFITPPGMAAGMAAVGNVSTSNYTYYVSVGNKLSFIEKSFKDTIHKDYRDLELS